ncbi:response regulator transcription factor [Helicovermis profundi]|uniref:Stage 0 sporulation protein A homolog n=1 Tax=Helicovermis profundi TaxID=3065157 RepID=A0AAU9E2T9_9FIRM|nr:response regulator transcription factor [Clostridia bacterium S502]
MAKKILIVEDEVKIARFLELELNHEGYIVELSHDGREGLNKGLENSYDLILLDVMLPSLNGMEVCRRIRQSLSVPIMMLTAKDDTMDKVMGLDIGADDYMTKPFAIEELLARIRKIFRNKKNVVKETHLLESGKLVINQDQHSVMYNNETIVLTKKEYDLLEYLIENTGIALSREQILENVWGFDYFGDTNVVDVYVRYLRTKIDIKFNVKLIHTVRGVGYLFKNDSLTDD